MMIEGYGLFAIFVVALMVFLATGVPVAVALGLIGAAGVALFVSLNSLAQLANIALNHGSSFMLTVVPLFVLMGEALAASTIGRDLFSVARRLLWRLPGSLPISTIVACGSFAAVSGSSPVTAATIGSIAVPEMVRNGYDHRLALGVTAAGGTLGILIPPSVPMILYGVITDTSIGSLFIAAILPGILMMVLLALTVQFILLRRPELAPPIAPPMFDDEPRAIRVVALVLLLAAAVIGSIYAGIATPTEAGAVGAAGALAITASVGCMTLAMLRRTFGAAVRTTAMFMLLMVGGLFCSFMLARLGVPQAMSDALVGSDLPAWLVIVLINLVLMLVGMFMDPMSVLVIMVPIFFPTVTALGYDPVWFGVIVTINIEIAAITPPVGFNLFVLRSVVPGVQLKEVISGALVFVVPLVLGIALLMMFPQVALFLPGLMR